MSRSAAVDSLYKYIFIDTGIGGLQSPGKVSNKINLSVKQFRCLKDLANILSC